MELLLAYGKCDDSKEGRRKTRGDLVKSRREATLFVNGKSFGTRRAPWVKNHIIFVEDNTLTYNGKEGERFEIAAEVSAGGFFPVVPGFGEATGPVLPGSFQDPKEEGRRTVIGSCPYGIWNEDAYQLYGCGNTASFAGGIG